MDFINEKLKNIILNSDFYKREVIFVLSNFGLKENDILEICNNGFDFKIPSRSVINKIKNKNDHLSVNRKKILKNIDFSIFKNGKEDFEKLFLKTISDNFKELNDAFNTLFNQNSYPKAFEKIFIKEIKQKKIYVSSFLNMIFSYNKKNKFLKFGFDFALKKSFRNKEMEKMFLNKIELLNYNNFKNVSFSSNNQTISINNSDIKEGANQALIRKHFMGKLERNPNFIRLFEEKDENGVKFYDFIINALNLKIKDEKFNSEEYFKSSSKFKQYSFIFDSCYKK